MSLVHCGGDDDEPDKSGPGSVCNPDAPVCDGALVCAEITSGEHRCYRPFVLHGEVVDARTGSAVEAAHVMALNDDGTAVTGVARTDAEGNYELVVPVVRNPDGSLADGDLTLRAAAQGYLPFPNGARVALPIDPTQALTEEPRFYLENPLTRVELIPLDSGAQSMLSGSIVSLEGERSSLAAGVLVVAKGADGAFSGLSDGNGDFSVFNLPPGDYELKAYGAGIQIESTTVSVPAEPLSDVELHQVDQATASVAGSVQIVNASGGSATSVVLVVEDTFDPNVARGEVPRGLRAPDSGDPDVSGSFSISGVPIGKYVALAAFENDDLVRDPDTNIAGTDFVQIEVRPGQSELTLSDAFKVTQALATLSPGAEEPEPVTEKPELVWADDSSEDWYDLRVFDAFGNEVWNRLKLPAVKGGSSASALYEGPLDPGMYYQFRVSAWRQPGGGDAAPISATEDLRGVFYLSGD